MSAPSINHAFLSGEKTDLLTKEKSELIRINPESWIIVSQIDDLTPYHDVSEYVDQTDYSDYTSAKGKNSKQYYFTNPAWLPADDFKIPEQWNKVSEDYRTVVQRLLIYHSVKPFDWKDLRTDSAWTVIGEEGSFHTIHDHGGECISSILYLKVPDVNRDEEVYKPGYPFFVIHGQSFNNISPPARRVIELKPYQGMLLIFPSWILHGVYPQGPGLRQTINVDFKGT